MLSAPASSAACSRPRCWASSSCRSSSSWCAARSRVARRPSLNPAPLSLCRRLIRGPRPLARLPDDQRASLPDQPPGGRPCPVRVHPGAHLPAPRPARTRSLAGPGRSRRRAARGQPGFRRGPRLARSLSRPPPAGGDRPRAEGEPRPPRRVGNIVKARAPYGVQRADLFPAISANAGAVRSRTPASVSGGQVPLDFTEYSANVGVAA